jgi:methyl-accepting chemotaxis protein
MKIQSTINNTPAGRSKWLSTVRARLYCAFGFAALLTTLGSVIAMYELNAIGTTTNEIFSHSFPATAVSLRLADEANILMSSAPRLMAANNDKARVDISKGIEVQAAQLAQRIVRLRKLGIEVVEIEKIRAALVQRLEALNQAVRERIIISEQRNHQATSIRTAHDNLLDGLVPAIDDANFDLMMNNKKFDPSASSTLESLRRLLEIESESNLLAGLLTEASLVNDVTKLEPLRDLIAAAKRKIEANLKNISDAAQQNRLSALYHQLAIISTDSGVIDLRTSELRRQQDAELAYIAAQTEAGKLEQAVEILVAQQSENARQNSQDASEQIATGKVVSIVLASAALLGAALIAWLYVGRNIAHRLGVLSQAMRRLSQGDLSDVIRDDRDDEIADMARALQVFRQASADAVAAREKEVEESRSLEVRRQKVDFATRNFENAVAGVVHTLDSAAKAMNSSAHAMADSALRNEEKAVATVASSEEATTSVETVAAAAEEIARSIEHIATRVSESAAIARQAVSEAEATIGAVEKLSVSVDEIGEISSLIQTIAHQTNLLALNATIEAARAGDAGRGFAVVAQEVKGLAAQTGKATEEITRQIQSIEQTTSRSVQAMQSIGATIGKMNDVANDVASAVRQQDAVTKEIARNANAAAQGNRHVSVNISDVSSTAATIGREANTVLKAADELAQQSNLLRLEVERYLTHVRVA